MYIKIENYRRFSIFVLSPIKSPRIYLYRNGFGNARKKIEIVRPSLSRYRYSLLLCLSSFPFLSLRLSLFAGLTRARIYLRYIFFLYSLFSRRAKEKERKGESTRHGRADTSPVWVLPRPYRQLSGRDVTQWGRQCSGQYTPCLLLDSIRPSQGAPPPIRPPTAVDFSLSLSLLSWNQHIPANLINIIADYAAPRSQWELRAKRYRRYEAPALCALLFPGFPAERITPTDVPSRICHSRKTSRQGNRKTERGRRRALSRKT